MIMFRRRFDAVQKLCKLHEGVCRDEEIFLRVEVDQFTGFHESTT